MTNIDKEQVKDLAVASGIETLLSLALDALQRTGISDAQEGAELEAYQIMQATYAEALLEVAVAKIKNGALFGEGVQFV